MHHKNQPDHVSVHGGHSGEFCCHAKDSLEEIINAYIEKGFSWVGITEHMPPVSDSFLYTDEKKEGLNAEKMYSRFERYILTCRELQRKYHHLIEILVGFETETYTGSEMFIKDLIRKFKPDYMVGSIHHVNNLEIDTSADHYNHAAESMGGIDELYCRYFDQQYEMIQALRPQVVGHFDLIRIFDPDYQSRLSKPIIREKTHRNLKAVKANSLILDFNMRALRKGAPEPYISSMILKRAMELKISVIPGDDSHGLSTVGQYVEQGIAILNGMGFDTKWKKPTRPTLKNTPEETV